MLRRLRLLACAWLLLCAALAASSAMAGVMTQDALAKRFPSPLMVGAKDSALPVWPMFRQNATANELVGYLFESIDFAPLPGFAGVPLNLLIALDSKGNFLDVQVLSQHEPVFLDGLGEVPLFKFVSQYRGLSLKQNIAIDTARKSGGSDGGNVHIDGVAKATASVRIINQSVLSAALKVARKKLGFAGARDPDQIARVKTDLIETLDLKALTAAGLLKRFTLTNREVEKTFAGSAGEGIDEAALAHPDDSFIELQFAYVSIPTIAHSLLTERDRKRLNGRLEDGDHALLVSWRGRYGAVSDDFIPGTLPDRLILSQGGLPLEMRDLNLDLALRPDATLPGATSKVFRVISQSGLDPSQPLDFSLRVTRLKGMIYPERISRDFAFHTHLPERYTIAAAGDNKSWLPLWKQRWPELALLGAALALLFAALSRSALLTADARRFRWFRYGYLAFTLLFIGWYAQGQLSIVNLTSVVQALKDGRSLGFLLYDPISIVLWAGVLVSLLIWGRGTFCGWLCPFGALQEFIAKLAQSLRLPQLRIKPALDAKLKWIKYAVLALILASAWFSSEITDRLIELEPFKTAITLNFIRSWPYVAYALALLALNAICYKAFCRYLCPLGAGLALLGRFRMLSWLARRAECGKPCQTCRHRCDYDAIRPDGSILYDDCFQCMDCVVIYQSDALCAPLIFEKKHGRAIPIRVVARAAGA